MTESVYWSGAPGFDDERRSQPPHSFDPQAELDAAILALLPRPRYRSGLELGCVVSTLTEQLARGCSALLAVDRVEAEVTAARRRCQALPQVQFQQMRVPEEYPSALFDLTVVAALGYDWSRDDLRIAQRRIVAHLEPRGQLLLAHCTPPAVQPPLSAELIHAAFLEQTQLTLRHLEGVRQPGFLIDLFERI